MHLCFCIASVHEQYLNSSLVDRYFLDKLINSRLNSQYTKLQFFF
jgi:hypothetical protein